MQGASYTDETTLLRDVAQRLHELARADHPPIVSIDGVGGAGKTTLAMRLAQLVGYQVVSFDDYVTPHKGSYLDHIDYPRLNRELERLRSTGHGVIVEGLLARAVLIQIEVAQDLSVYMRRVDPYGEWEDSSICSEDNDLEEVFGWLARLERLPGIGDHDRELAKYHVEQKPISSAGYVYDRKHVPPEVLASA